MRHPIRSLTLFGGLALTTAALSGCGAEETPSSNPSPVTIPPAKSSPAPAPAVSDMKPADTKGPDTKPAETKLDVPKAAETKPGDTKPTLEPPAASSDPKDAAKPKS